MLSNQIINAFRFNKFFWVLLGLLFLLNIVFYAFFIVPQEEKMAALQSSYHSIRNRQAPKNGSQTEIYRAKGDTRTFLDQLPYRFQFSNIVIEIVQILKKQGLPISKMIFEPEYNADIKLMKYTSSFSLEGEYAHIKAFLADIQNSKTLFCIESLSLSKLHNFEKKIAMKIKISSYLR